MGTVTNSLKGAFRIGQTVSVLGRAGVNWVRGDRPPAPRLLRQTFESLGATYIKLGQFIASSPTFFPKEYVEEFQYCLDRTPSLPFSVIRKIIRDELGRPIEDVYSDIDPVALASASIAQVHAAKLVTGEDVVIKVQKPGVENILLTDPVPVRENSGDPGAQTILDFVVRNRGGNPAHHAGGVRLHQGSEQP